MSIELLLGQLKALRAQAAAMINTIDALTMTANAMAEEHNARVLAETAERAERAEAAPAACPHLADDRVRTMGGELCTACSKTIPMMKEGADVSG